MIIDDPRGDNKIIEKTLLCRETMLERSMDGQENIKIVIKSSRLVGEPKTNVRKQNEDVIAVVWGIKQQKQ